MTARAPAMKRACLPLLSRRGLITAASAAAAAWASAARSQQAERVRRIGVLMNVAAHDPLAQNELVAFASALQDRGWVSGSNLEIESRWGAGEAALYKKYAAELVTFGPEAILAIGGTAVAALQQATSTIPIVFAKTTDPVSRGLVVSLARPGGHTTGFLQYEFGTAGKWLELLKQIMPRVKRAAVIRDVTQTSGIGQMAAIQAVAPSFGIEVSPINAPEDEAELKRAIMDFTKGSDAGLVVTESGKSILHRKLIIELAAEHGLPAVYPYRYFVADGGLIAYGPDELDAFGLAAGYVDRILRGEKPGNLPVQAPTKYQLSINMKTARGLRLQIPDELLARANEVIE